MVPPDLALSILQPHLESLFCSLTIGSLQYEYQTLLTSGPLHMLFPLSVQYSLPLPPQLLLFILRYTSGPGLSLRNTIS